MTLRNLLKLYSEKNCNKVYVKSLAANDNSKNQVYLGGSFDILNILPASDIVTDTKGVRRRESFKSKLNFSWLDDEGNLSVAPHAQLILYPDYPEVRFSGFLKSSNRAPSELMSNRIVGRLLFFGISNRGEIFGYVTGSENEIAKELNSQSEIPTWGVFKELTIEHGSIELNSKEKLLKELKRINKLGWINSKRLDNRGNVLACSASNCGGYTLEAELGITPNGYSEPDYLGWEVKQFAVKSFSRVNSSIITLMTPEPTHGFYVDEGVEPFILKYGYKDKMGREARMNFGGVHKFGEVHESTKLKFLISGFDAETNKITDTNGFIGLIDVNDKIAASWSFTSLLRHWTTKHASACYVPSMNRKGTKNSLLLQYSYGSNIILGEMTDFSLLLKEIQRGNVYYDPGIKLEFAIKGKRDKKIKRRSQFRIKSSHLSNLYKKNEIIDLQSRVWNK